MKEIQSPSLRDGWEKIARIETDTKLRSERYVTIWTDAGAHQSPSPRLRCLVCGLFRGVLGGYLV
ncbi:hypothetical protein ACFL2Q_11895 [Thermodesulfobacteriota bacterium]